MAGERCGGGVADEVRGGRIRQDHPLRAVVHRGELPARVAVRLGTPGGRRRARDRQPRGRVQQRARARVAAAACLGAPKEALRRRVQDEEPLALALEPRRTAHVRVGAVARAVRLGELGGDERAAAEAREEGGELAVRPQRDVRIRQVDEEVEPRRDGQRGRKGGEEEFDHRERAPADRATHAEPAHVGQRAKGRVERRRDRRVGARVHVQEEEVGRVVESAHEAADSRVRVAAVAHDEVRQREAARRDGEGARGIGVDGVHRRERTARLELELALDRAPAAALDCGQRWQRGDVTVEMVEDANRARERRGRRSGQRDHGRGSGLGGEGVRDFGGG